MQKTLWDLTVKQYKTFAVVESEECKLELHLDRCVSGRAWKVPDPAIVEYRRPEMVARIEVNFVGVVREQEWYLLIFEFACEAEGGHVKVPLFIRRYVVGGDKGFLIVHDFRTAFSIPLNTFDEYSIFSGHEGVEKIKEYIREALPLSISMTPAVQILFLNHDLLAKLNREAQGA